MNLSRIEAGGPVDYILVGKSFLFNYLGGILNDQNVSFTKKKIVVLSILRSKPDFFENRNLILELILSDCVDPLRPN